MPHRRSTKIMRKMLQGYPRIMITDPWQVMLAVAALGVGIASLITMFIPHVNSVVDRTLWTSGLRASWSVCFIASGVFQIIALQRSYGRLERLGIFLGGLGWLAYVGSLVANGSLASTFLVVIFLFLALGHFGVLLVGVVVRRLGGL